MFIFPKKKRVKVNIKQTKIIFFYSWGPTRFNLSPTYFH